MAILEKFFKKRELRLEKISKSREEYVSFLAIYNSNGWKVWQQCVDKKIENISKRMTEDATLDGEELKKLQLALAVWRDVRNLPKTLEEKAKVGVK